MNNKQEMKEIFETLREFAQKNKGEFWCGIKYPIEAKKLSLQIRSEGYPDPMPLDVLEALMGSQSSQTMSKELSIIFNTLRDFARKNDAEFLCKVRYPIGGKPELFFDNKGDSDVLLKQFERLP
jgi:hypothetical protein